MYWLDGAGEKPMTRLIQGQININVLLAFVFGVTFVCVMLGFALFVPNPSNFSQWVFITVLALASAGVGAVIPGMLNVELPFAKAGGALALFIIVFATKPAIVGVTANIVFPSTSPAPVITSFLQKIDGNKLDEAFDQLDDDAKSTFAKDRGQLKQIYHAARDPLGAVADRSEIGVTQQASPSGYPVGAYRSVTFRTKFASGLCYAELVTVRATNALEWKIYNHNILPTPIPCS
jgi:Protein of unknown function (DUF4019)